MRDYAMARWLTECSGPYVGGELSHWVDRCEKAERAGAALPPYPLGRDDRRQPLDRVEGCARWALRNFPEGGTPYAAAVAATQVAVEEQRKAYGG